MKEEYGRKKGIRSPKTAIMQVSINKLKGSKLYSEELDIDLKKNDDKELFKWFLASILFGTRISETIAKNTYKAFENYDLLEPKKILDAGWGLLVNPVMREGGYVRYDWKTSTQILKNCEMLVTEYNGSLKNLHKEAKDNKDLEKKLMDFYGIGPVTANIFLRELRPLWRKSDPEPLPIVKKVAEKYEVDIKEYNRKSLDFVRIEAGLIRLRNVIKKDSIL
ncbi:hypothetical protein [Methanococcoides vulcani]|nr:hypothetical protein [Methanococcoides vulcani]